MLEKNVKPVALLRRLLVRGSFYRVGGQSIRQFRTLIDLYKCTLFIFFFTWFRARTRIRWVALVRSVGLITID